MTTDPKFPHRKHTDDENRFSGRFGGDHAGALQDLMPLAERGNAAARNLAGVIYAAGQGGIVCDDTAAAHWTRLAAEQEHTPAQFTLGIMFEHGQGVSQNIAEAAQWYFRAARTGHAEAQFRVGRLYQLGAGVGGIL